MAKVLIVDDNHDAADTLSLLLQMWATARLRRMTERVPWPLRQALARMSSFWTSRCQTSAALKLRDDCKPSLLMHKIDATLNTQMGGNAFLDEEREHMALPRADLLTHNKIKTISTPCPQVTSAQ